MLCYNDLRHIFEKKLVINGRGCLNPAKWISMGCETREIDMNQDWYTWTGRKRACLIEYHTMMQWFPPGSFYSSISSASRPKGWREVPIPVPRPQVHPNNSCITPSARVYRGKHMWSRIGSVPFAHNPWNLSTSRKHTAAAIHPKLTSVPTFRRIRFVVRATCKQAIDRSSASARLSFCSPWVMHATV